MLTQNYYKQKKRLALETEGGVTSLEGQLVNSRMPEIYRYSDLFTHAFRCILLSQHLRARSTLVVSKQTRITATRLVLAVILNSSETILVGQFPTVG